jgi:cytochrome c oxidase subunit IV
MALITTVEVALGAYWKEWFPQSWDFVKLGYIVLTLVKAYLIVSIFMHLGDERRNIRSIILLPYALFILYLLFIAIWESNYVHTMLRDFM